MGYDYSVYAETFKTDLSKEEFDKAHKNFLEFLKKDEAWKLIPGDFENTFEETWNFHYENGVVQTDNGWSSRRQDEGALALFISTVISENNKPIDLTCHGEDYYQWGYRIKKNKVIALSCETMWHQHEEYSLDPEVLMELLL